MHLLSRLLGILQTEMRDFATLLIPEALKLKLPFCKEPPCIGHLSEYPPGFHSSQLIASQSTRIPEPLFMPISHLNTAAPDPTFYTVHAELR